MIGENTIIVEFSECIADPGYHCQVYNRFAALRKCVGFTSLDCLARKVFIRLTSVDPSCLFSRSPLKRREKWKGAAFTQPQFCPYRIEPVRENGLASRVGQRRDQRNVGIVARQRVVAGKAGPRSWKVSAAGLARPSDDLQSLDEDHLVSLQLVLFSEFAEFSQNLLIFQTYVLLKF